MCAKYLGHDLCLRSSSDGFAYCRHSVALHISSAGPGELNQDPLFGCMASYYQRWVHY